MACADFFCCACIVLAVGLEVIAVNGIIRSKKIVFERLFSVKDVLFAVIASKAFYESNLISVRLL